MTNNKDVQIVGESGGRKYQAMWNTLKELEYLDLDAPKESHNTILKALRKESGKDSVFRFKCVENGVSYTIGFNSLDGLLLLRLEWKDYIPKKFTYKAK